MTRGKMPAGGASAYRIPRVRSPNVRNVPVRESSRAARFRATMLRERLMPRAPGDQCPKWTMPKCIIVKISENVLTTITRAM